MSNHALYTSFNRVLKLAEKICPVQPLIVREGKKIGDRFLEDSLNVIIAKFIVSVLCAVRFACFGFFCSANHLSGPLRKCMFTCTSSKGHGL